MKPNVYILFVSSRSRFLLILKFVATLAICATITSCTSPQLQNISANSRLPADMSLSERYSFWNWVNDRHLKKITPDLIIVTFSGGGIRAAALAASTIEELRKFSINGKPLTDNIVFISSTSGGSIAAGYMAAHGLNQYSKFREQFLTRSNTSALIFTGFGPRIISDRSGIMQDFLEKRLDLDGLKFSQLLANADRPYFLFNATDLSSGETFQFNQRDFDLLCTHLGTIPISAGITASSSIPFLLTDVEFKNRWDDCSLDKSRFAVLDNILNPAEDIKRSRARYNYVHAYENSHSTDPHPTILHLSDGGLADNLGIRSLFNEIDIDLMSTISRMIEEKGQGGIRQILVLEVNARNDVTDRKLNSDIGSPSLLKMLFLTSGIPIDQTTTLSANYARKEFSNVVIGGAQYVKSGILHVQIDFDALPDTDAALRTKVKSIGMGLTLQADELESLENASRILLRNSPCFARFVGQSGASAPDYKLRPRDGTTGWPWDCMSLTDYGAE